MHKELLVSDESLNNRGLRIRTSGGDFSRFNANPIMLFNHIRVTADSKEVILPIGTWKDLRVEGVQIFATPVFDSEGDKFAKKIEGKFNRGVMRGASMGIMPVEVNFHTDEKGEEDLWVDKWQLMELTFCDIPSNQNAVAFYNSDSEPIELNAVINMAVKSNKKELPMSKLLFVPALLGLAADASDEAVRTKLLEMQEQNAEIITLKAENAAFKAANKAREAKEVTDMVNLAIEQEKIPADMREHYINLAAGNVDAVKAILDGMKPAKYVKLSAIPKKDVNTGGGDGVATKHNGKTFKELQKTDSKALIALKSDDYEKFCTMYKETYNKDYIG